MLTPREDRSRERGAEIREKFTSPSRERPTYESIKRFEDKQAKAQETRERLLGEKAQRYKEKAKKAGEIKLWQEEQQQQKIVEMNMKLQKADELRKQQIIRIKRKAHDEEHKVSEILFINTLEAQAKRHDILIKEKDHEARLLDLQEERQRKQEEKAAKEAACEDRRKALEAEHQAKLVMIQEKRKEKDRKLEEQLQEKEKERLKQATLKQRSRQQKISAVNAAHQANVDELQKKILLKLEASQKRYQESMDLKRQKAIESSIRRCSESPQNDDAPRSAPYETQKMCSLCKVIIGSEVYLYSHLRGKRHQDAVRDQHHGKTLSCEELELYNLRHIVDAPFDWKANDFNPELASLDLDRLKCIHKRCKKLKQRMAIKSCAFEKQWKMNKSRSSLSSPNKLKINKSLRELNGLNEDCRVIGQWPSNMVHSLERILSALERLVLCSIKDKITFASQDGLHLLTNLLSRMMTSSREKPACVFPEKTFVHICSLFKTICDETAENCYYVFHSNIISLLLDCLAHRLALLTSTLTSVNSNFLNRKWDALAAALSKLMVAAIDTFLTKRDSNDVSSSDEQQRINDVISYSVSIGIVDKLSLCIVNAQGPVDDEPELANFLQDSVSFLTTLAKLLAIGRTTESFLTNSKPEREDATQLIITLRMTQIGGVVPLVYGMLLHTGHVLSRGQPSSLSSIPSPTPSPNFPKHTLDVATVCLGLLNHVASIDLQMLQTMLGSEGLSLQLRHISSFLLWYCSQCKEDTESLLHEVILLLGYFTVLNPDNQVVVQAGQKPTILEQLCSMPFGYFSDSRLKEILFPTLICCCYDNQDNKAVLEDEMSPVMLISWIESIMVDLQLKAVAKHKSTTTANVFDEKWTLATRFPKNQWIRAKLFFDESTSEC
ncbi:S phase cyclin A-associated protein in the endoplasmic reticulum [Halotydeus destructor]|nr:S phase cyclin A-associated protein in the endoplasmic reticulum [Halotydeus destructor]